MNKKIRINATLNVIKTIIGIAFPLITFPYVSRVLDVEALGIYNFCFSIISYFSLIAGVGISTYAIRECSEFRDNKEMQIQLIREIFSINILSTIIAYILLGVSVISIQRLSGNVNIIMILSIEILFTTIGVSWIYNIYEDFLFITIRTVLLQLLSLVGVFLFVKDKGDLIVYALVGATANVFTNLFNFIYANIKYCRIKILLKCRLKKHIKPILIIFSTTIAIAIYVNSDVTMLGFMTDDYQVGLYSVSVKIYTIIKNVFAAMLIVLLPRFSLLFSSGNRKKSSELFSEIFDILFFLIVPASVGLFMESEDIIFLLSGVNYLNATWSLKILSIATIFALFSYLYTQCILIPNRKEKIVFVATAISAGINIIMNFILIPVMKINATAATTLIAEIIVYLIARRYSKEYISIRPNIKGIFSVLIASISIVPICIIVGLIVNGIYARLLISIIGSVLVYLILLGILRYPIVIDLMNKIIKKPV